MVSALDFQLDPQGAEESYSTEMLACVGGT